MLLWLLMIGGVGALALAYMAMRGPSAGKSVKRRMELIKERHGRLRGELLSIGNTMSTGRSMDCSKSCD